MLNDEKIQRVISLIIVNIIVLASAFVLSNLVYAKEYRELNEKTLYEITKHSSSEYPHVTVGNSPYDIGFNYVTNTMYVANSEDGTVSVIDGENNTKIGDDIKVGKGPWDMGFNPFTNTIYVTNQENGTVSVIDALKNRKIGDDIKVGAGPTNIGVNRYRNTIYVVNQLNGTVSVIDALKNRKIGDDIKVGAGPSHIGVNVGTNTIYVVNGLDNTTSVISGKKNNTKIKDIEVGKGPSDIGVNTDTNTIYVANSEDGTVSVIDGENNTKIGDDIKVGKGPSHIGVNEDTNTIYVVRDDTVSVIDGENNTKIGDDIKVGKGPVAIGVNEDTNTIYVANSEDDTVSIIDGENNTKIGDDIKVGAGPAAIGVNEITNTVYVANSNDGTVSVIDGKTNKVVAKIMLKVEPFNTGRIECDNLIAPDKVIAPIAQEFYINSDSQCTAKPNQGFEFVSWQENLPGNSTQYMKFSSPPSAWDSFLDFLHMKPDKPEATLKITKFGSFTANFKELPAPIPVEYVATLLSVVATAFIGSWLTPTVIEWRRTRKQGSKLDHYHNEIKNLYNDGKLDSNDIEKLNNLRDNITDEYTRSRISKEQYDKLAEEISMSYREILTKKIDSLNGIPEDKKVKVIYKINEEISDAYAKGKINELHYTLLKEKISKYEEYKT